MIYAENILICILIPLLVSLLFTTGRARQFVIAFCVGMLLCLLSAYVSGFTEVALGLNENSVSIYISPIIEEIMKMLPILFCIFVLQSEDKPLIHMAVGIGAGFATFENCCKILTSGADVFTYVLIRGLAVGIMHLVCVLLLTFGVIMTRKYKAMSFASILGSLSLSATYHGLYNLLVSQSGISSAIGYALPIISVLYLFITYKRMTQN